MLRTCQYFFMRDSLPAMYRPLPGLKRTRTKGRVGFFTGALEELARESKHWTSPDDWAVVARRNLFAKSRWRHYGSAAKKRPDELLPVRIVASRPNSRRHRNAELSRFTVRSGLRSRMVQRPGRLPVEAD